MSAPIEILPREERAYQGNPEITVWCDKCQEQTIPADDGKCLWCGTKITEPKKRRSGRRAQP